MSNRVSISVERQIATVTLNRADKMNALDMAMFIAIDQAIKSLKKDRTIRAIILTASGKNFCSGIDIKSAMSSPLNALKLLFKWLPWQSNLAQRVSTGWRTIPVPVIALVQGRCWGGGLQLALGADFIVATPGAEFSIMEGRWGLIPDMGGTLPFRERLTLAKAKELTMSAKVLASNEALAAGLVDYVVDQPMTKANELIDAFINQSPDSVAGCKKLMNKSWVSSAGMALLRESYYQVRILLGKNQKIKAYNQLNPDTKKHFKDRKSW